MVAKKSGSTSSSGSAVPNRRAKHGADPAAAAARSATTRRVVAKVTADPSPAEVGEDLCAKSTRGVTAVSRDRHPGHDAHRKGFDVDQAVKSLAHIYTPWANVGASGSGIVALAAWTTRLEGEGKEAVRPVGDDTTAFNRGLIHR